MFAVESKTVRVRFQEGNDKKTYAIQWTELLTTSENPFESLSKIIPGTEVLAPYYDSGDKINYSIAIVAGIRTQYLQNIAVQVLWCLSVLYTQLWYFVVKTTTMQRNKFLFLVVCIGNPKPQKKMPVKKKVVTKSKEKVLFPYTYGYTFYLISAR